LKKISRSDILIDDFKVRWDNLKSSIDNFDSIIEEQKENVKKILNNKILKLQEDFKLFENKWSYTKIKKTDYKNFYNCIDILKTVNQQREDYNKLLLEIEKTNQESANFNLHNHNPEINSIRSKLDT